MSEVVYVQRDGAGSIIGVFALPQPGYAEEAVEWPIPPSLAERRNVIVEAIDAAAAAVLELGAPFSGKRVQVTNGSRADLSGLALTASLAISGAVAWPGSYADGWIAIDNTRIAMPAPADGIALAYAAGVWYSTVRQNARSLKDAVLASDNPEIVDITSGWPS